MRLSRQNNNLKEKARYLRKNSTLSEVLLWNKLKNKQLYGLNFDRQKVINNRYILDFYCPVLKLAIEINGCSHDNKCEYDIKRHNYLTGVGIKVLYFDDLEIKKDIDKALYALERYVANTLKL